MASSSFSSMSRFRRRSLGWGAAGATSLPKPVPPLHHHARPMGAEHAVRRVVEVALRVVAPLGDDGLRVLAGPIPLHPAGEPSPASGVGGHVQHIVGHGGYGGGTGEHHAPARLLRGPVLAAHGLDVADGPAHVANGHLQPEAVVGLQQHALGLHEPLAHRPVGGLAEIPALGMLEMGSAGDQRDLHVRQRRAGEHPQMLLLRQMGQDEPLPVQIQVVLADRGGKLQPAARFPRLQQQMDLRIVAQRLEMAHPLHGGGDGLPVEDAPRAHGDLQIEPLPDQGYQHVRLQRPHELGLDLPQIGLPGDVEQGLLFLQLSKLRQHRPGIHPGRQIDPIPQGRGQERRLGVRLRPQALAWPGLGEPGHRHHVPGGDGLDRLELLPGIQPQLGRLLLHHFPSALR